MRYAAPTADLASASPERPTRRHARSAGLRGAMLAIPATLLALASLAQAQQAGPAPVESMQISPPVEVVVEMNSDLLLYDVCWSDSMQANREQIAAAALEQIVDPGKMYVLRFPQLPDRWGELRNQLRRDRKLNGTFRAMDGSVAVLDRELRKRLADTYERDVEMALIDIIKMIRNRRPGVVLSVAGYDPGRRGQAYAELMKNVDFIFADLSERQANVLERRRARWDNRGLGLEEQLARQRKLLRRYGLGMDDEVVIDFGGDWLATASKPITDPLIDETPDASAVATWQAAADQETNGEATPREPAPVVAPSDAPADAAPATNPPADQQTTPPPAPEPSPTPEPSPEPAPAPAPTPQPEPTPEPTPQPAPDPFVASFTNAPAVYQIGSGLDLALSIQSGAPADATVVFGVSVAATQQVVSVFTDAVAPYVYPAAILDQTPPGDGQVIAMVMNSLGATVGEVSQSMTFVAPAPPPDPQPAPDPGGWTTFTKSADTKVVYVSSSSGSDANTGLSESDPVKTLAKASSLMRNGFPDWMLLKRGDVWTNENFGIWEKSGRSSAEPMLFSAYGVGPRPLLRTGTSNGFESKFQAKVSNIAIVGLDFAAHTYTGAGSAVGVRWLANGANLLIENCRFDGYSTNLIIQATGGRLNGFTLRRNVIVNAYSIDSHSQGLYAEGVDNLLIEENVFDHNGWKEGVAPQTVFNHNMYIQVDCTGLVVRGNISSRASSHGLQARPGGIVEDNVFIQNPLALSFGYVLGGHVPLAGGVSGRIVNNVILESNDIGSSTRGFAMEIGNLKPGGQSVISGNIIAHYASAQPWGQVFELVGSNGVGVHDVVIEHNTIYDWHENIRANGVGGSALSAITVRDNLFQSPDLDAKIAIYEPSPDTTGFTYAGNVYDSRRDPALWFGMAAPGPTYYGMTSPNGGWAALSGETGRAERVAFVDPNRSTGSYNASLGGVATHDALMAEAAKQSQQSWRPEYTAAALLTYFREGFRPVNNLGANSPGAMPPAP